MDVDQAEEKDIPEIVALLKESLGEGLMQKSEVYWRWKHVDNPFGRSPVLVARDAGQIIGVRAFMRWQWRNLDDCISSVRAVDTATHPQFQGKGIFRELTMALLSQCAEEGVSFVFNTPNEKSKPGYLKMGWEEVGRMPVRIYTRRPFRIVSHLFLGNRQSDALSDDDSIKKLLKNPSLEALIRAHTNNSDSINSYTLLSTSYLAWRYLTVPVAKYAVATVGEPDIRALIIYRIKKTHLGLEMRITDWLAESKFVYKQMTQLIHKKAHEHNVDYVTMEALRGPNILGRVSIKKSIGPMVTARRVAAESVSELIGFRNWRPGIGDLELF